MTYIFHETSIVPSSAKWDKHHFYSLLSHLLFLFSLLFLPSFFYKIIIWIIHSMKHQLCLQRSEISIIYYSLLSHLQFFLLFLLHFLNKIIIQMFLSLISTQTCLSLGQWPPRSGWSAASCGPWRGGRRHPDAAGTASRAPPRGSVTGRRSTPTFVSSCSPCHWRLQDLRAGKNYRLI